MIQHLLREAAGEGIDNELVSVAPDGFEAQADWTKPGLSRDLPRLRAGAEPRLSRRCRVRGAAQGSALHRGAHPCRRHRPGRGVPALPRRPRREFQRGGDSRDRRRRRQHERLDADQTCRGRDAGRPATLTSRAACDDHPMSIDRTWLAGSKRGLVGEAGPRRSAPRRFGISSNSSERLTRTRSHPSRPTHPIASPAGASGTSRTTCNPR